MVLDVDLLVKKVQLGLGRARAELRAQIRETGRD